MAAFTPHALYLVPATVTTDAALFCCRCAVGMMMADGAVPLPDYVLCMPESNRCVEVFQAVNIDLVGKGLSFADRGTDHQHPDQYSADSGERTHALSSCLSE